MRSNSRRCNERAVGRGMARETVGEALWCSRIAGERSERPSWLLGLAVMFCGLVLGAGCTTGSGGDFSRPPLGAGETPNPCEGIEGAPDDDFNLEDDNCNGLVDEDRVRPGDVVITEVMADPLVGEHLGEYIELYNTTEYEIDLANWVLIDQDGGVFVFPEASTVMGGTWFVMARSDASSENGGLLPDLVYDTLVLSNEGTLSLELRAGPVPIHQLEINQYNVYQSAPGRALNFDGAFLPLDVNLLSDKWCGATSSYGASIQYGTPGSANDLCDQVDHDGDGIAIVDSDCDDEDPYIHPGAFDVCGDGIDQDCDRVDVSCDDSDDDLDGFSENEGDCDDEDAAIFPGALELCEDDIDQDCDGSDPSCDELLDEDQDGFTNLGGDCDDGSADINPMQPDSTFDGVDNDCDGLVDEQARLVGDIIITEIMRNPEAVSDSIGEYVELFNVSEREIDLKGLRLVDVGDGEEIIIDESIVMDQETYVLLGRSADLGLGGWVQVDFVYSGFNLEDAGWVELDLVDDWGSIDWVSIPLEAAGASIQLDGVSLSHEWSVQQDRWCLAFAAPLADADFGSPGLENDLCEGVDHDGDGLSIEGGDCDDGVPSIHPSASEICENGVDEDCDGQDALCVADQDGDGYAQEEGDCDDGNATISPGGRDDQCDGRDNDCDGWVDEACRVAGDLIFTEVMRDPDALSDSFGEYIELYNTAEHEVDLRGLTLVDGDGQGFTIDESVVLPMDDYAILARSADSSRNGAVPVDIEYGGALILANEGTLQLTLVDGDVIINEITLGEPLPGASTQLDSEHLSAAYNEIEGTWCATASSQMTSGDRGSPGGRNERCDSVDHDNDGFSVFKGDCDDDFAAVFPDAPEQCGDGVDQDCDGEDLSCLDVDDDGDGQTEREGDCDDEDPSIFVGGVDVCDDDVDQDCSGQDLDCREHDGDGDGFTEVQGDCNDVDPDVSPAVTDDSDDGVDNNCDGLVDEAYREPGELVITEVMRNPGAISDSFGEYIELFNTADRTIDLYGIEVVLNGEDGFVVDQSVLVPAESYVLLARSAELVLGGDLGADYVYGDVSAPNSGELEMAVMGGEQVLFEVVLGETSEGAASQVDSAHVGSNDPAFWCEATSRMEGDLDKGSPGERNEPCATLDHDGDGFSAEEGDCDDTNPRVNPDAYEICEDEIDQDCDGRDPDCSQVDHDKDGYSEDRGDCNDYNPTIHPRAEEQCGDLIDQDCDGEDLSCLEDDGDGDGFTELQGDCDDEDPSVNPDQEDNSLDGVDNNCDGLTDEAYRRPGDLIFTEVMRDPEAVSDTYGEYIEIYNTTERLIDMKGLVLDATGAEQPVTIETSVLAAAQSFVVLVRVKETQLNGGVQADYELGSFILENEGELTLVMMDGGLGFDVAIVPQSEAGRALQLDAAFFDDDANQEVGNWCEAATAFEVGGDRGSPGEENASCTSIDHDGDGYSVDDGDCDDTLPEISPDSEDVCDDDVDQDCDGHDLSCQDVDDDGDGQTEREGDCDDAEASVYAGADEVCDDGVDQDCSGLDLDCREHDGDGDGFTEEDGDCDDAAADISPAAADDTIDGVDNNCDGLTDEAYRQPGDLIFTEVMRDPGAVSDTYGEYIEIYNTTERLIDLKGIELDATGAEQPVMIETSVLAAAQSFVVLARVEDAQLNGGAPADYELGSFILQNDGELFLVMMDGEVELDSATVPESAEGKALQLDSAFFNGDDNQDVESWCEATAPIEAGGDLGSPGRANELCSSIDHDGDGYAAGEECDDESADVFPGAEDICGDGIDQDCAGGDPACPESVDDDGDGYSEEDGDCDDADPSINPAQPDNTLDGIDQNCNGVVDDEYLETGDIIISEVMRDPEAVSDSYGEYIEIYNTSERILSLYGLEILDETDGESFVIDEAILLTAQTYFVLGRSGDSNLNGGVPVDYEYDHLILQNDGELVLSVLAGELELDGMANVDAVLGASVGLDPAALDHQANDRAESWCEATVLISGAGDFGTPGEDHNECQGLDRDRDGYTYLDGDCDDTDADVYPYADEICDDGVDSDCDGQELDCSIVDACALGLPECPDEDNDGDGQSELGGDCDDTDPAVFAGAPDPADDLWDLVDNDCDGLVDEDLVAAGDLVITEIMKNPPSVANTDGEWFEVYNQTERDIDMIGWSLRDGFGHDVVINRSVVVGAGWQIVLGVNDDLTTNGGIDVDYEYWGLVLPNDGNGSLALIAMGTVIDEVTYTDDFCDTPGVAQQLSIRSYSAAANDSRSAWCPPSEFILLDEETGEGICQLLPATPGQWNHECPAPCVCAP